MRFDLSHAQGMALAFWILIGSGTGASNLARAQEPISQMIHKSWTVQDGAPNNISSFVRGKDGLLWLATDEGLYRFDGYNFRRYKPSSGNELQSQHLNKLAMAPDGGLWVSYLFGGISRIESGKVTNYTPQAGLPPNQIISFAIDRRGVWLTNSAEVYRITDSKVSLIQPPKGVQWRPHRLIADDSGDIWLTEPGRVMLLPADRDEFQVVATLPNSAVPVCSVTETSAVLCDDGAEWRGEFDYTDGHVVQSSKYDLPATYAYLHAKDGSFWAMTYGHGIKRFVMSAPASRSRLAAIETFDKRSGLSSDDPNAYKEDREGNIWISTDRGLDQFRSVPIRTADVPAGTGVVIAKGGDNKPGVFIAVDRLLSVENGVTKQITKGFMDNFARSLYGSSDGTIWIGANSSLWHFVGGKTTKQDLPPDLAGPVIGVQSITEDAEHGIWISVTRNGVYRLYKGQWARKGGHEGLPNETPLSLGRDHSGGVWAGYLDGRMASVSPSGQVRVWDVSSGPRIGAIKVFAPLGDGLLIGGEDGVSIFSRGHFSSLNLVGGTALHGVTGIVVSRDGDLWSNSSLGIVRVPESDLAKARTIPSLKVNFELFDYHDGVQDLPSPLLGLNSAVQGPDGYLYFASRQHVNWISPRSIRRNPIAPLITIDEMKSGAKTIAWPESSLKLEPNPQSVQIHYEAGSLLVPDRVHFRYRLDNYDKDWVDAGLSRTASYSKLPPGNYTFHVIACNDAGVWNNVGASVIFTVTPTLTQTFWFRFGLFLLAVILLFFSFRLRLIATKRRVANQMYDIMTERQRIARDLHDTLLQSVQAIMFKVGVAANDLSADNPVKPVLEQTIKQSDLVLMDGRRLISSLQVREETSRVLLETLETIAEDQKSTCPEIEFTIGAQGPERLLNTIVHQEVCTIGREALTNACRHAHASRVAVSLHAAADFLRLEVRDNGRGIDKEILARGYRPGHWGLRNMEERTDRLGGRFVLQSSSETGTVIEVYVPAFVAYKDEPRNLREKLRRWLG